MKKINIGLIGAGGWGRDHARGYYQAPNVELVAVADIEKSNADRLKDEFGIAKAYGKVEDLLSDSRVDAVSIVIPNKFHAEVALQALEAGKPVMLDKPFAMNLSEAEKVVKAADRFGQVFMMGMNQRFDANTQTVKALIEGGEVGEIYHAKAYWLRRSGIPARSNWFAHKALSGGGPMIDLGVHMLDLCLYLLDNFEPVTVSASTYDKLGSRMIATKSDQNGVVSENQYDVEDFATAMIRMKNGATLQLEASWVLHIDEANQKNIQFFGTDGGLSLNPPRLYKFGRIEGEYINTELAPPSPLRFPHCSRYQHFADVLQGKSVQLVSWSQSLTVQRVLDAVYESARSGREVVL